MLLAGLLGRAVGAAVNCRFPDVVTFVCRGGGIGGGEWEDLMMVGWTLGSPAAVARTSFE